MKKLEKLRLHNFHEISVNEQESIKGGGYWITIDGQSVYVLDEVEIVGHAPVNWACSNEHGVIIAGFVLEGPDGSGGLFGAGQNFGHLKQEDKEALMSIGTSILGNIFRIMDPLIISAEHLWKSYFDNTNGEETVISFNLNGEKVIIDPNVQMNN
jgi:hypothetical protein